MTDDTPTDKLRIFGNYRIYFNHSHWEVRGRHDKLVVGQCHTQDEAAGKALDKVRRAMAARQLQGLDTVWLF